MIFNKLETLEVKGRFNWYPNLVCGLDRNLYQLTHFKKRRTCYFKKIKYNEKRKGYQINSVWVSKNRLLNPNNFLEKLETVEI